MFAKEPLYNNIMAYHGPISLDLTSFVGTYLRNAMIADDKDIKRIFKVFVELVQNVSNYSAQVNNRIQDEQQRNNGIGWFSIDEDEKAFKVSTGNLIAREHGPILQQNCEEINKLNEEELRDLKRKTRKLASIRDVGAHIGLIHTGIITKNAIEVEVDIVDEVHAYFKITAQLNKTENN